MHFSYPILRSFLSELSMSRSMLAAAARADKSRCFCCESDFKIVSPASSVSLAVVCARSNVSERVSALETEFTSASLRSSSLSTAKEFLPPPPPLDSTSKFPRDDFDFSNCVLRAFARERERETRQFGRRTRDAEKTRTSVRTNRYDWAGFSNHHPRLMMTLSQISKRLFSSRDERDDVSSAVSKTKGRLEKEEQHQHQSIYMYLKKKRASYRCGLLFSSHFSLVLVAREEYLSSRSSRIIYVHQ